MTHLDGNQTIWAFTLAFTLYAGWADGHTRRIPNWLTVPGLFVAIALRSFLAGWKGTETALEGAGLALLILLPLVLMRALGAGDWKLMGAVGGFLGPIMFLFVLLASIFVSGLMAFILMIQAKRVKATLRNMGVLMRGFFAFGLRPHPDISLDNPALLKLPFGVAAAIGTLICFAATRWGL